MTSNKTIMVNGSNNILDNSRILNNFHSENVVNNNDKSFLSINDDINPFLNASKKLFREIYNLSVMEDVDDMINISQNMQQEIDNFSNIAIEYGVDSRHLHIARYMMCTFGDELIANSTWAGHHDWGSVSLLAKYYHETYGGNKFFELLTKFEIEPTEYIYLLELAYVCLSFGFGGKYKQEIDGYSRLEAVKENLYLQIKTTRPQRERFYASHPSAKRHHKLYSKISKKIIISMSIIFISLIYLIFTYIIDINESTLILEIQEEYNIIKDKNVK